MSGPTLALGISALGADQVKQLAQSVGQLDSALASLQARGGSNNAQLGSLAALTAEVTKIRQGLGEASAGLRTELADLKQNVSKAISESFAGIGQKAKSSAKQAGDDVDQGIDAFTARLMVGSEKIKAAQAAAAEREAMSNSSFVIRMQRSLAAFRQGRAEVVEAVTGSGIDTYTARLLVGSEKISAAQALAAQREEASRLAWLAKMQTGALKIEGARKAEAEAQILMAARYNESVAKADAIYKAASERSQTLQAFKAASLLESGVAAERVTQQFGSMAVAAAQAAGSSQTLLSGITQVGRTAGEAIHFGSNAFRELGTLLGEILGGNFSRVRQSLFALANQMGFLKQVFTSTGLLVAAAGGAFALFGTALTQGQLELSNFEKQATLTGRAIGLSASGFVQVRDALEGIGVTKGKAAQALDAIAASGMIAGTNVKEIANAAIQLERATGEPIAKTVKQFLELSEKPAEAAAKLDQTFHFLTGTVYEQIKSLEEHGRTQEAAALAEDTFATSMTQRSQRILDSQGYIQKGWRGITEAAKEAWDTMLGIGREDSLAEKLKKAAEAVDTTRRGLGLRQSGGVVTETPSGAAIVVPRGVLPRSASDTATAGENEHDAFIRVRAEETGVANAAARAIQQEADRRFAAMQDADRQRYDKLQLELDTIRNTGREAGRPQSQIDQLLAAAQTKYDKGNTAAGNIAGQQDVAAAQAKKYQDLLNAGNFTSDNPQLTNAEKQVLEYTDKLAVTTDKLKLSHLQAALAAAQHAVADDQLEQSAKLAWEAGKKGTQQQLEEVATNYKSAESIRLKASEVAFENANLGKNKTAVEEAKLAADQKELSDLNYLENVNPREIASIKEKTAAQAEYVKQLQQLEIHGEKKRLDEEARVAKEETKSINEQVSLLGLSAEQRDVILAQRKSELDLAKELARIDALNSDDEVAKEALRAEARATARVTAENAANKKIADQWQKTADDINKGLTDALLSGFESGKSAAIALRDYIKKMFAETILRPIISGALAPISGFAAQAGSAVTGTALNYMGLGANTVGAGAGSTLMSGAYGTGTGVAGAFNAGYAGVSGYGYAGAGGASMMGGTATAGTALATDATGATVLAGAAGDTAATSGLMAGGSAALGAIPVVGWIALAAIAAYAIFGGKGGGPKTESGTGIYPQTPANLGDPTGANQLAGNIEGGYKSIADSLGLLNDKISVGLFYSKDPQGTAQTQLAVASANYNRADLYGGSTENAGRTDAEFQHAVALASAQLILAELQHSDLTGKVADYLKGFSVTSSSLETLQTALQVAQDVATLDKALEGLGSSFQGLVDASVYATEQFVKDMGGIQNASSVLNNFIGNFFSDVEKKNATAKSISNSLEKTGLHVSAEQILGMSRAQYRALVEGAQAAPSGKLYETLLSLSDAFATIVPAADSAGNSITDLTTKLQDVGSSLWEYVRSLGIDRAGTASPQDQLKNARLAYTEDIALAKSGDYDAYKRVQSDSQTYVEAAKTNFASGTATQDVINQVIAEVSSLPAVRSYDQQQITKLSDIFTQLTHAPQDTATSMSVSLESYFSSFSNTVQSAYQAATGDLTNIFGDTSLQNITAITDGSSQITSAVTQQTDTISAQMADLIAQVEALTATAQQQAAIAAAQAALTQQGTDAIVGAVQSSSVDPVAQSTGVTTYDSQGGGT